MELKKMKKLYICLVVVFVMAGMMLAACRDASSSSLLGDWKLVSYGSPSKLTPAVADVDTSLVFDKEGKVSGSVGCNSFGGDYKVDGTKITFESVVSTLMFCEGPVGDQETTTLNVLAGEATFALDGNNLTITSADGSSVIVLAKNK
jgi:heat shock protein HslJ